MPRLRAFLLVAATWLLWDGCSASHKTLTDSLDEIGIADLKDIVADLPPKAKGAILSKPYYIRDEYEEYMGDSSIVFQARATLIFFYLDPKLDLCQVRKYRYRTTSGFWDRYDVKLIHVPKKFIGT